MFIHFGLNTFNETEWSDGTLPVSSYHPDQLDCDQWSFEQT
jgi:alpha-L-fucosidase